LEDIVIKGLQHNLMAPDLVKEFVAAANEEFNKSRRDEAAEREAVSVKLTKIDKQVEAIVDAITNGTYSTALKARLEALEAERSDLVQKLASPAPSPVRLLPNLADAYRQKVADLSAALYAEETRAEAFEIVRSLIEKVVIHEGEDGKAQIELIGDIAAMVEVALGSEQQKTARGRAVFGDREKRSVKVVAGTGNHRELSCWA
jgi:hypothetical protein